MNTVRTAGAKVAVPDGADMRHVFYDDLPPGAEIVGLSVINMDGRQGVYFPSFHYRFSKPTDDAVTADGRTTIGHILVGPYEWPEPELRAGMIEHGGWDGRIERWPWCIPLRVEATEEWQDEGVALLAHGREEGRLRVSFNTLPAHLTNVLSDEERRQLDY